MPTQIQEYFSVKEVCQIFNISRSKLWDLRKRGKLVPKLIDGSVRYEKKIIENFKKTLKEAK